MSSSGDKTALEGRLWKCPASFWGAEWSKLVDNDHTLNKFDWVKLKTYKPAKQSRGMTISAHYLFDCQEETDNVVTIDEIDLEDTQESKEGLNLFCLCVFDVGTIFLSHHSWGRKQNQWSQTWPSKKHARLCPELPV